MGRRRDEYSEIYEGYTGDNGDDRDFDYSDLSGYEPAFDEEKALQHVREDVDMGPCMRCDEPTMERDGGKFTCTYCGYSVSEEEYFRWYIENVSLDEYDDIYG